MNGQKFYRCEICGNLVGMIHSAGVPLVCCGQEMTELEAGSTDASLEKHVPVVTRDHDGVTVQVGALPHPMTNEHQIEWIYLQTERGGQRKKLLTGEQPKLTFCVKDDTPIAVYAYCNLHGLWMTEL